MSVYVERFDVLSSNDACVEDACLQTEVKVRSMAQGYPALPTGIATEGNGYGTQPYIIVSNRNYSKLQQ